ncbi:MAG: hypothetical protein WBV85_04525 [Solirubrobacteraceae bacterium]
MTAPLGLLLASLLLASFASTALASNYEMRGEWSLTLSATHGTSFSGTDTINKMEVNGEYSGSGSFVNGLLPAAISGTVSGGETSINIVADTPTEGVITFVATNMTIDLAKNTFSGSGTYYNEKHEPYETGTISATRTHSYQEMLEREAREKKENEERQARSNIRGEWEFTLTVGPQTEKGLALITAEANAQNAFSSASTIFEGVDPGTFSGILEGKEASVVLTNQAIGSVPAGEFTSNTINVSSASNPTSMSGTGTFKFPSASIETVGELKATKIHTYTEVKEREAKEAKEAKEAEEKIEQVAIEQRAKAAKEAEEARAKQARAAQEAKEKLEQEAFQKSIIKTPAPTLVSAEPSAKTLAAGGSGKVSLKLVNPNTLAIHGHLTLVARVAKGAGKASAGKGTGMVTLGSASFTISANGSETLKITLSKSGQTALKRLKTLQVTLEIATEATGETSVNKKYTLTLREQSRHGKG